MLLLGLLSFGCEYINASLGMGYGTALTPILLIMAYPPSVIVPTVLLPGPLTGLISGGFRYACSNLFLRKGSRDRGVIAVLASMGMIGSAAAVFAATSLSGRVIEIYIGSMVFLMGIPVHVFRDPRRRGSFPLGRIDLPMHLEVSAGRPKSNGPLGLPTERPASFASVLPT